jgi:deferrochelatase/peroxidase EfeB
MTTRGSGITRREALTGVAALGAGVGIDRLISTSTPAARNDRATVAAVPFYGQHQAGIATSAQEYLYFAAFDVATDGRAELIDTLQQWTTAAASLTAGDPFDGDEQELDQPPAEPGEALGLGPARLTLTFGFGPGLFGSGRADRFGLGARRSAELQPLPAFRGESIERRSPAEISASRRAPTIRRWRFTQSTCSPALPPGASCRAGRSWALGGLRAPAVASLRRAT